MAPSDSSDLSDAKVQRILGIKAVSECLRIPQAEALVEVGPLSVNNFSFTFPIHVRTSTGVRDIFVKIPKVDMRGSVPRIIPISAGDRQLAFEEESSLRMLQQRWPGDEHNVRWVSLCGTVPEFNALVTERIEACDIYPIIRQWELIRRFTFRRSFQMKRTLERLGASLGRYHESNAGRRIFRSADVVAKCDFYCERLSVRCGSEWADRMRRKLKSIGDFECEGILAPTLKGLDIRNVLMDEKGGLFLLDPGKTKITHREADLARFIMTFRIVFWGSSLLVVAGEPDPAAESAFLDAYYGNSQPPNPRMLNLFLLKEQLKHWHTALDSLQFRKWPKIVKRLAAAVYVNPFYKRQIARQLRLISV